MSIDSVEAVLAELERRKQQAKPAHRQLYWKEGASTELGAQFKTQIACYLVKAASAGTLRSLAAAAISQHAKFEGNVIFVPKKARGPVRTDLFGQEWRDYDEDTYRRWLNGRERIAPKGDALERVEAAILAAADELLAGYLVPDATLTELLTDFKGTAREALERSLDLLSDPPRAGDWSHIPSEIHGIVPSIPTQPWSEGLEANFNRAVAALRFLPSIEVTGPHYSGKHSLLRRVFAEHRNTGFRTDTGALIPMFAISLHEAPAAEAIGHLASFYRNAVGAARGVDGVPGWLEEISIYARRVPVLVIVAGLEAVNDNEISRALNQDPFGEMIARILDGHPETRLLVSRSASEAPSGLHKPRRSGFAAIDLHTLMFDEQIALADPQLGPLQHEYRALHRAATALHARSPREDQIDPETALGPAWISEQDLPTSAVDTETLERLSHHILRHQLTAVEQNCLSLVALSHDGLQKSTIRDIVRALHGASRQGADWDFEPTAILDGLPAEIVQKPSRAGGDVSSCYTIERAFRERLVSYWRDEAPDMFRTSCWGIARAALREARRLRCRYGVHVAAARDVQVIILLLGALDPAQMTMAGFDGVPTEDGILPALEDRGAAMPSSDAILTFVKQVLFEGDLVRSVEHQASVLGDARLRLAAVLPFLDPSTPWRTAAPDDDPGAWPLDGDLVPWVFLDTGTKLHLLVFATAAAARLNLPRLVSHFASVAEKLSSPEDLTALDYSRLARIHLHELDLGILAGHAGRDRQSLKLAGRQGSDTLDNVLRKATAPTRAVPTHLRHTPEGISAQVKLFARRAEILHLSGRHRAAHLRFEQAARLASALQTNGAMPNSPMAGRSRRMYIRLLVELARAELFEEKPEPVRYKDNLQLPMLHRSDRRPTPLKLAEAISNQSIRELTSGSASDWIGTKIDRARLASVKLHYAEALDLLTQARSNVRGPGVGRDIILELLSVHGRTLTDAAAFAMAIAYPPRGTIVRADYLAEAQALARFLQKDASPSSATERLDVAGLSFALCAEAVDCLDRLKALTVFADGTKARYGLFASYLEVWIQVVRSRQWIDEKDVEAVRTRVKAQLLQAAANLEVIIGNMVATGYMMHWREVRLLIGALKTKGIHVAVHKDFRGA